MKTFELKRVPPPDPPPPPKLCVACKGFRAECIVPVGEASAPMCWICAHHVVDHNCAPHDAATAECECLPHEIYPSRTPPTVDELIAERMRYQHGDVDYSKPMSCEDLLRGSSLSDACRERARDTVRNMTAGQRAVITHGSVLPAQLPYERSYDTMQGMKAAKMWVDEPLAPVPTVTERRARRKAL